jgi:proteasome lid subunit RPN8/RPN11
MKKLKLNIDEQAMAIMKRDAIEAFPNECCGFFFGHEDGERNVKLAIPAKNSREGDQRRRFKISPLDYMWAEQYAAEKGLLLLGIYHSHPLHPALPSEHDRIQAMPWFSYVIISTDGENAETVNSFQLNEQRIFEQEDLLNSNQ